MDTATQEATRGDVQGYDRAVGKVQRYRMSAAEYHSAKHDLAGIESRIAKGEVEASEYKNRADFLRSNIQAYRLDELFSYHPPNEDQQAKYEWLRRAARDFAGVVLEITPEGADQSEALRLIRTAVMTANAAIALNGLS
jgi:hypothetical protein